MRKIVVSKSSTMLSKHDWSVVVACWLSLQFFVLDVVVNSIRLSDDNMYAQLKRIVQMAEEGQAEGNVDQVGILTGAKRNVWATARRLLAQGKSCRHPVDCVSPLTSTFKMITEISEVWQIRDNAL